MVGTIIQRLRGQTSLGANNTSVQIATGKLKSQDAQGLSQPVQQKHKPKASAVQPITAEASRKQTQNPVLAVLGQGGLQREIRASKTPQPAKPAAKHKPKAAQSTKAELLQVPGIVVALTPTVVQSGEPGKRKTVVPKTRQAVPKVSTTKRKAAASTTPAKKRTKKQTPAQTPTGRKSKARGS
jgi:hypothetical protein